MEEITLKDVETAIKVLMIFERKMREAQRVLRRLGIKQGMYTMPRSFQDFMNLAFASAKARTEEMEGEVEEEELSEEELKRLRKIAEKVKKK